MSFFRELGALSLSSMWLCVAAGCSNPADGANSSAEPLRDVLSRRAQAIATGSAHTCVIDEEDAVSCWGANGSGQLGDGSLDPSLTPVSVTGRATAVVAGEDFTCRLEPGGMVSCWGEGDDGRLGTGSTMDQTSPQIVGLPSSAIAIAAGWRHACAALTDGSAYCWGDNAWRQLGDGSTSDQLSPVRVPSLARVVGLAAGTGHTCALRADGTVACWGANGVGQVGNGGFATPVTVATTVVGLGNVTHLGAGSDHTCAVRADGTVWCWGYNALGQLGDGAVSDAPAPTLASSLTDAELVTGGLFHTCARRATGEVACWGMGGLVGDGTSTDRLTPTTLAAPTDVLSISASLGEFTCALTPGGAWCWGANGSGQLGDGTSYSLSTSPVAVAGLSSPPSHYAVALGDHHGCALDADGDAYCWGSNAAGQLGDGTVLPSATPVAVAGLAGAARDVAAGSQHSVVLLADGSVQAFGAGLRGQLGDGSTSGSTSPVTVSGVSPALDVAAGKNHACAVVSGGTVSCWGANDWGQLGDGTMGTDRSTAVTVGGVGGAVAVATGEHHSCALLANGRVRCWGRNDRGQIGDGTWTPRASSIQVAGITTAVAITAGAHHTCALLASGVAQCWGWNSYQQLGIGIVGNVNAPRNVTVVGASVVGIVAGGEHTCVVRNDGMGGCWGRDDRGQLGDGAATAGSTPAPAFTGGATDVLDLALGRENTCFRRAGGDIGCAGDDTNGELGDGTPGGYAATWSFFAL